MLTLIRRSAMLLAATLLLGVATACGRAEPGLGAGVALPAELVYMRDADGDGRAEIVRIGTDGRATGTVAGTSEGDALPAWSPDGAWLAHIRSDPQRSQVLEVARADGSERHVVSGDVVGAMEFAWSPDGTRLAFSGMSEPRRLPAPTGTPLPGAPPSGPTAIAVPQVYVVDRGGGDLRNLSDPSSQGDSMLGWSPDGRRIVFGRNPDGTQTEIWVMDADGHNQHPVSHDLRLAQMASWSPDGNWIAFVGWPDLYARLYIVRPDGAGQQRLAPDDLHPLWPSWSPDGRSLAFVAGSDLYLIDVPGGTPRRVATDIGHYASRPAWSPDGRWLALLVQRRSGEVRGPWSLGVVRSDAGDASLTILAQDAIQSGQVSWRQSTKG